MTKRLKNGWLFMTERRASFTFTIGSIMYGVFHILNPSFMANVRIYEPLDIVFQMVGGKLLGTLFVVLGMLKLFGIIKDIVYLKLPLYFCLMFLWVLLSVTLFISFLLGNINSMWICTSMVALLSTNIVNVYSRGDVLG